MSAVLRAPGAAPLWRPQARPTVGLADAFAEECEMFALALSSGGFRVDILPDRMDAAYEAVRARHPAVVVSRITPERFGIDLVTRMRAEGDTKGIPVILLTSYAIPHWQTAGRAAGADAVLLLPVLVETLCDLAWQLADRR